MKKKIIIFFTSVTAAILLFISFYSFPHKVHVERAAVSFVDNRPDTAKPTKLKIDGTLYKPLFGKGRFVGNFVIDTYDFTAKDYIRPIHIVMKEQEFNMGTLVYESSSTLQSTYSGSIWFDNHFKFINIWPDSIWDESISKGDRLFITTGTDYEQAKQTQQRMEKLFGEWFVPRKE